MNKSRWKQGRTRKCYYVRGESLAWCIDVSVLTGGTSLAPCAVLGHACQGDRFQELWSTSSCRVIRTCPLRFADSEEPVAADAGGAIVRLCRQWWPGVRTTWLQFYNRKEVTSFDFWTFWPSAPISLSPNVHFFCLIIRSRKFFWQISHLVIGRVFWVINRVF